MCGICGKLNFDRDEPVAPDLVPRMLGLIGHRGPDGGGEFRDGAIALGHRRLSIIDLRTGAQPMANEDGSIQVVFNGEIYNFRQLRAELEACGHRFKSTSDTEVVVHLYEQYGDAAVSRLEGMFAFALWDTRHHRLLLARDRVGIKPLYYVNTGRALLFASELKCLLADGSVPRRVNPRAIDRFLTYYYGPGSETPFEGVYKLDPAHYLTVCGGAVKTARYWELEFAQETAPRKPHVRFPAAVRTLQQLLGRAVADHLISDVPVGVLLSGGVDSTGVLAHAADSGRDLHSFTIGFGGAGVADERPYARLAARRFHTRHQEITITPQQFQAFLPDYVWHMEELVCEPPAVALYYVATLARDSGVKVLLSGEGGDEAFGGYQNYRNLLALERLKRAFGPARPLLGAGLRAAARLGWSRVAPYGRLIDPQLRDYYFSRSATPATPFNRVKRTLYRSDFAAALGGHASDEPTRRLFNRSSGLSILNQMLHVDTGSWLPDDLLVKADKMTMATSVELRVPLLDVRVLEFAASLPASFKLRGWSGKRILKAALAGSVPAEILARRKAGFPVPYGRWIQTDLADFVRDTLLAPTAALTGYFQPSAIRDLVDACIRMGRGSKEVFSLLVLELWLRRFMTARA